MKDFSFTFFSFKLSWTTMKSETKTVFSMAKPEETETRTGLLLPSADILSLRQQSRKRQVRTSKTLKFYFSSDTFSNFYYLPTLFQTLIFFSKLFWNFKTNFLFLRFYFEKLEFKHQIIFHICFITTFAFFSDNNTSYISFGNFLKTYIFLKKTLYIFFTNLSSFFSRNIYFFQHNVKNTHCLFIVTFLFFEE